MYVAECSGFNLYSLNSTMGEDADGRVVANERVVNDLARDKAIRQNILAVWFRMWFSLVCFSVVPCVVPSLLHCDDSLV